MICRECAGKGRVELFTSAVRCAACNGTGRASGPYKVTTWASVKDDATVETDKSSGITYRCLRHEETTSDGRTYVRVFNVRL